MILEVKHILVRTFDCPQMNADTFEMDRLHTSLEIGGVVVNHEIFRSIYPDYHVCIHMHAHAAI